MARGKDRPAGGLADWLIDRVLRGLIATIGLIPYAARVRFMGWIVSRVIAPAAGYRRRAMENLAYIWPDLPREEHRRIAIGATDNLGRTLAENYSRGAFRGRMANVALTGPGVEQVLTAHTAGRAIIFATGHFGNHEAPRAALHAAGVTVGGLYRPMRNPFFNEHYASTMTDMSGPVFEQGRRGTMGFVKHLREGGAATILFDVYDGSGAIFDFLGKPAPTPTSAADLALKYDALLVPYFGPRGADGLSHAALIEAPIPHGDPVEMMQALSARLEAQIAAHPDQWFWIHRRWKPKRTARTLARRAAEAEREQATES